MRLDNISPARAKFTSYLKEILSSTPHRKKLAQDRTLENIVEGVNPAAFLLPDVDTSVEEVIDSCGKIYYLGVSKINSYLTDRLAAYVKTPTEWLQLKSQILDQPEGILFQGQNVLTFDLLTIFDFIRRKIQFKKEFYPKTDAQQAYL